MVVRFLAGDAPQEQQQEQLEQQLPPAARRKKFLVAHSSEQTNSIFDYVHRSTTLLRKVRFGQPIELAIQKPAAEPRTKNTREVADASPSTLARKDQRTLLGPSLLAAPPPRLGTRPIHDSYIGYNRVVRFQASDGGFLLVESDGCVRKVPKEHESDPRTLVTLFSRDPHANIGKRPKRVRSGDCVYLVQGSSASLATDVGVTQADSDEMIDGPRHLVSDVRRHDTIAAQTIGTHQLERQSSSSAVSSPHASLSKQSIRKKQLDQAFTPAAESMPTTVWCLAKAAAAANDASAYFRHGALCHIFQNQFVVCYEMQSFAKSNTVAGSAAASGSQEPPRSVGASSRPGSSALQSPATERELSSRSSPSEPATPTRSSNSLFTHVWLQEASRPMLSYHPASCQCYASGGCGDASLWDNTWRICDVSVKEKDPPAPDATRRSRQPNGSQLCQSPPLPPESVEQRSEDEALEEETDDGDDLESEDSTPGALHRQTSVFDVVTFAAKAETLQARAACIIVRFFRRLIRDELTQSRVQDFLRRRRRVTQAKTQFADPELTATEQLKLLQCYNPHVYGSRRHFQQHGKPTRQRPRRGVSFHNFTSGAEADRQKLATMQCNVDYLSQDWLRTEKHNVSKLLAANAHEMYSRRPLSSSITPKRILANREREHQFVVEMKMAKREPPSFHYGGGGARPHTAPLAAINSELFSGAVR